MKKMKLAVLAVAAALLLTACGGGANYTGSMSNGGESWDAPTASDWGEPTENFSQAEEARSGSTFPASNVKMIYRASMSIETLDFDRASAGLEALVGSLGGYFENSSVYQGGYYADSYLRNGNYTVRVPSGQYETFLSSVSENENCHVTQLDRTTENVGEVYYDTEARLKTQQIKLERLQELLSRAEQMEDIILLESEISNVEYEIEQLSSTLNRYDGLIDFATIEVSLRQVARLSDTAEEHEGVGAQMLRGLQAGALEFCDGVAAWMVWCSYHLIGIVIFLVIVVLAVRFVRKGLRAGKWKKGPKGPDADIDRKN